MAQSRKEGQGPGVAEKRKRVLMSHQRIAKSKETGQQREGGSKTAVPAEASTRGAANPQKRGGRANQKGRQGKDRKVLKKRTKKSSKA